MSRFSRIEHSRKVALCLALQPVMASSLIVLAASLLAVVGLFVHGIQAAEFWSGDTMSSMRSPLSTQEQLAMLQSTLADYAYFSTRILLAAGFLLCLLTGAGLARWALLKRRWSLLRGSASSPDQASSSIDRGESNPSGFKTSVGDRLRSKIGHELRNPISAVISCLEAAMTDRIVGQNMGVRRAHQASLDMLDLLNRMLDASRLAEQKLWLQPEPFSLKSLLRKSTEAAVIQAQRKNIALLVDLPPDTPDLLHGDAFRLRQVLVNLIGNAIKFTDEGEIILGATHRKVDSTHIELSLRVEDTGCGISEAQMQKLFKAYGQHDEQRGSRYGGTGLGLYICKELVERMGGQIQVRSSPGEGTAFLMTLPFELQQAGGAPSPSSQKEDTLIIVANNLAESALLENNLSPYFGKTLVHASLAELAANQLPPHIRLHLLVSLHSTNGHQPERDNLHLGRDIDWAKMERIVLIEGGVSASPCLGASGQSRPHVVIQRPALPADILDAFFIVGNEPALGEPQTSDQPLLQGVSVLLAEDTATLREVTSETLRSWGADVQCVSNGSEAVACVLRGDKCFDVILMDVDMPFMNGMEATRRIRNCFSAVQLPVIALTSHDMEIQVQACLSSGMNTHQSKPVNFNELAHLILKFKSGQGSGKVVDPALHPLGGGLRSGSPIYLNGLAHFEAEYTSWLEGPASSETLDRSRVHQLRGAASLLGANQLVGLCRQFEVGWDSSGPEDKAAAANKIRGELRRVLQSIRQSLKHEAIQ